MTQQQQSREFDVSDLSSIPPTSISNFKKQKHKQFHSWTQTAKLQYFKQCEIIQTINERKDKRDIKSKKIKNLSKEGRRELWPPQEGGVGVRFSNKNWEGAAGAHYSEPPSVLYP